MSLIAPWADDPPYVHPRLRNKPNKQRGLHGLDALLWRAQDGLCFLCGLPLALPDVNRDHLHPRSRGGPDRGNLVLAHPLLSAGSLVCLRRG